VRARARSGSARTNTHSRKARTRTQHASRTRDHWPRGCTSFGIGSFLSRRSFSPLGLACVLSLSLSLSLFLFASHRSSLLPHYVYIIVPSPATQCRLKFTHSVSSVMFSPRPSRAPFELRAPPAAVSPHRCSRRCDAVRCGVVWCSAVWCTHAPLNATAREGGWRVIVSDSRASHGVCVPVTSRQARRHCAVRRFLR